MEAGGKEGLITNPENIASACWRDGRCTSEIVPFTLSGRRFPHEGARAWLRIREASMRLTYLDEAGTARHEPYFVVGAVIIEADTQLVAVERHLDELAEKPSRARQVGIYFSHDRYMEREEILWGQGKLDSRKTPRDLNRFGAGSGEVRPPYFAR